MSGFIYIKGAQLQKKINVKLKAKRSTQERKWAEAPEVPEIKHLAESE